MTNTTVGFRKLFLHLQQLWNWQFSFICLSNEFIWPDKLLPAQNTFPFIPAQTGERKEKWHYLHLEADAMIEDERDWRLKLWLGYGTRIKQAMKGHSHANSKREDLGKWPGTKTKPFPSKEIGWWARSREELWLARHGDLFLQVNIKVKS